MPDCITKWVVYYRMSHNMGLVQLWTYLCLFDHMLQRMGVVDIFKLTVKIVTRYNWFENNLAAPSSLSHAVLYCTMYCVLKKKTITTTIACKIVFKYTPAHLLKMPNLFSEHFGYDFCLCINQHNCLDQ